MSRFKKLLLLTAIIFLALAIFLFTRAQSINISQDQQQTIALWGNPDQFVLSYLPQEDGEKNNLVRYEVWYYFEQAKKVTFLAGETLSIAEWVPDEIAIHSSYFPWEFDFFTNYAELKAKHGDEWLHLIDLPGFSGEGLNAYASEDLLLVLEDDHLTYVQSLALDSSIKEDAIKQYANSDLGFSIEYPNAWQLNSGVLSNYDTNYLISGEVMPEKIMKCDFVPYDLANFSLGELNLVHEADYKIYRTQIVDEVADEDMGFGDNVVFLFEDEVHQPLTLICFAYDEALELELLNILKTFNFLD